MLALAPTIVEIVYWSALISIPYGEGLSRLLASSVSKGGGSAGSYGEELPKHVEEPTCESFPTAFGCALTRTSHLRASDVQLHASFALQTLLETYPTARYPCDPRR